MLRSVLKWEIVTKSKQISLQDVTGMFVSNTGDVAFDFCGQIIAPGKRLQIPIFGQPTSINQQLNFRNTAGIKSAVLEYTKIDNNLNNNLCKG